jgi:hypothetical protein
VTETLSRASVPFDVRLLTDGGLAGDRIAADDLKEFGTVVLPGCWWLTDHQVTTLLGHLDAGGPVLATGDVGTNATGADRDRLRAHPGLVRVGPIDLLEHLAGGPQVVCSTGLATNLYRLPDGRIAAHLVNYDYDDEQDCVRVATSVRLNVVLADALMTAEVVSPGRPPMPLTVTSRGSGHTVELEAVGVYTIVVFTPSRADG